MQIFLPFNFLSKNIKITIYRSVILPVVFMGVKGGRTQRKVSGPGVFHNRVLRRIFGPKRDEVTG